MLVKLIVIPLQLYAGFDQMRMGIVIVLPINLGGLTPPVGVIVFTVRGILDVKTGAYARAAMPFLVALSVYLPNLLMN